MNRSTLLSTIATDICTGCGVTAATMDSVLDDIANNCVMPEDLAGSGANAIPNFTITTAGTPAATSLTLTSWDASTGAPVGDFTFSINGIASQSRFHCYSNGWGMQFFIDTNLADDNNSPIDGTLGAVRFAFENDGGTSFGVQMAPPYFTTWGRNTSRSSAHISTDRATRIRQSATPTNKATLPPLC